MSKLDEINILSNVAPGFVWRLKSEAGNTTDIKLIYEPWFIVDRSVWLSIEPLSYFTKILPKPFWLAKGSA